jgi:RNA polymerase sigma-70 factor, ECF subfamily
MTESEHNQFTAIYNKYKKTLYNYLLKVMKNTWAAEDTVHNVFIKYFNSADTIADKTKTEYWLFKTARNEAFDYFRKNKIKPGEITEFIRMPESGTPETDVENEEMLAIINNALDTMDPGMREVFILKEYSGLSYKEIAAVMEIPENLVKSRLFNVREKLRIVLKENFGDAL